MVARRPVFLNILSLADMPGAWEALERGRANLLPTLAKGLSLVPSPGPLGPWAPGMLDAGRSPGPRDHGAPSVLFRGWLQWEVSIHAEP